MARTIGGAPQGLTEAYIPEADGNRGDVDPVTIVFRHPTQQDRRQAMRNITSVLDKPTLAELSEHAEGGARHGQPLPGNVGSLMTEYRGLLVASQVVSVENYFRAGPDPDNPIPITTGSDFARFAPDDMFYDVQKRIQETDELGVDLKKKSAGSSGSTEGPIIPSTGTAESVSKGDTTKGGIAAARVYRASGT